MWACFISEFLNCWWIDWFIIKRQLPIVFQMIWPSCVNLGVKELTKVFLDLQKLYHMVNIGGFHRVHWEGNYIAYSNSRWLPKEEKIQLFQEKKEGPEKREGENEKGEGSKEWGKGRQILVNFCIYWAQIRINTMVC